MSTGDVASLEKLAPPGSGSGNTEVVTPSHSLPVGDRKNTEDEDSGVDVSKPGDDGQEKTETVTDEDTNNADDSGQEQGQATPKQSEENEDSKKDPLLFCPITHRLHSNLLDFSIYTCPSCYQSLTDNWNSDQTAKPTYSPFYSRPRPAFDPYGLAEPENPVIEPEEEKVEDEKFIHAVEYRDSTDTIILTEDSTGPFNFEETRNGMKTKQSEKKGSVFKVLTILRTNLMSDGTGRPLMKEDIMGNPNLSLTIDSRKLIIESQPFIDALRSVVTYESGTLLETTTLQLFEPYSLIIHHLDELRLRMAHLDECNAVCSIKDSSAADGAESDEPQAGNGGKHVRLVLDFIDDTFGDLIRNEIRRNNKSPALCTFRMLWYLYKPGDTVYVTSDGKTDACVVWSVSMGDAVLSCPDEQLQDCVINMWYLDYDGVYVTRALRVESIQSFQGEKPITSLKVVPAALQDKIDGGKLRTKLEEEGKKWYRLLTGQQVHYKGDLVGKRGHPIDGRLYVDPSSYYELEAPVSLGFTRMSELNLGAPNATTSMAPGPATGFDSSGALNGCNCSSCKEKRQRNESSKSIKVKPTLQQWDDYDSIDPKTVKTLEKTGATQSPLHRYLICSRNLRAFVFKTRKWETLDVEFCRDPKPNKTPFKHLVMPEERKMMIEALVYKYTDPRYAGSGGTQVWGADFIKNKGEGQIFLLHGGPGVGKTFTAECIAEFTGRPLLALTCGDIGTEEVEMEKQLGKWLKLAHKWGAVMLIDEADVFLEKRLEADLKRNSLVSVFLREIEYYQGILFLTTNRVGQFDDAFISRIHVVIHYPDLGRTEQRKIWNQFFDKLEDERGDTMEVPKATRRYVLDEEICRYKWNGREIRNAFQTAVALAEYRFITKANKEEGEIAVLEEKDFKQVCDMTIRFKDYLTEVNDGDDEYERARRTKSRTVVE
ncbi:hypothetical protein GGS26DRAFT_602779 [Hypomontagnella submonticulosa]|nr:hypothetical protein GGS26DRAFT_602779 [Hypomontagnella submonticulosa]